MKFVISGKNIEVTDGLKEGDLVVYDMTGSVTEGMSVVAVPAAQESDQTPAASETGAADETSVPENEAADETSVPENEAADGTDASETEASGETAVPETEASTETESVQAGK